MSSDRGRAIRKADLAEGDVWISGFFSDSTYVHGVKVDWDSAGWREVAQKRHPPPETLPLPVYAEYQDDTLQDLPPVFQGGGGVNVCPAMADVFRQFDLVADGDGKGGVFPIQLFLYDRKTPVRTDYSVLVYGGFKLGSLIPEESKGLRAGKYASDPPQRWMLSKIGDGDIAVCASVRSGSDIWFDPKLQSAVFMSDRLVHALKDAGFAKYFNPIRCRVIEIH